LFIKKWGEGRGEERRGVFLAISVETLQKAVA
jgi:hypothetical protein